MKTTILIILLSLGMKGQVEDSLISFTERISDTTLTKDIQCGNYKYTYLIQNSLNTTTFTLLNETKLYTDYRKIGGLSYFFGAWALMIGHNGIEKDKVLHFGAGYTIGLLTYSITKKHRVIKSIAASITIGILKELILDRGNESIKDAVWTGVGGYYGSVTIPMIKIKPVKPIFLN